MLGVHHPGALARKVSFCEDCDQFLGRQASFAANVTSTKDGDPYSQFFHGEFVGREQCGMDCALLLQTVERKEQFCCTYQLVKLFCGVCATTLTN